MLQTVGVWRRYSDFKELSERVMNGHGEGCATALQSMHPMSVTEEAETELMPNAITSWRLLKKRQRWFRCLDAGYLSLKVFLLERFLHDILVSVATCFAYIALLTLIHYACMFMPFANNTLSTSLLFSLRAVLLGCCENLLA